MKLLDDTATVVIAHAGLGNGKSTVAEMVGGLAVAAGRPAYLLTKRSPSMHDELSYLCSMNARFVLVVDSYPAWMDALEFVGSHRNDNMSLFLTARTGLNDVLVDRVEELFKKRVVHEIELNRMDDDELEDINDMFEKYGLWGGKAALPRGSRLQHLRNRCRAEWQSILVDLFQSPDIQARFDAVLNTLNQKGDITMLCWACWRLLF